MLFWTVVKAGIKSLRANKLRSFLAMLGIIIGVASVIALLSVGTGAQAQVMERINAMGTDLLIIRQGGWRPMHGVMTGESGKPLTLEDAEAILNEVEGVTAVAPVVNGSAQVKFMNRNMRATIVGTAVTYLEIRNYQIENGRSFSEAEVESGSRVAIIGSEVASQLFKEEDPVGQVIKIKGINFKVTGTLKSRGDQGFFNPDEMVLIPYTTAMQKVFGLTNVREIDVQGRDRTSLSNIQEEAAALLRKRHRIEEGAEDDFTIRSQSEMLETASSVTQTFTVLLGTIASISLIVGGIGIMNIMLVSVTERTREIGIRKAIGARNSDILRQFLIESVIMTATGGVVGTAVGTGAAKIIGACSTFRTTVTPGSIILALIFAGFVGIFFGYYPAKRASMLNPVEALRYE